ncbi:MAG: VOC family protein [Actinobacteria bacterium]|nr:VOC family protein [Actinomycetota bacterium]
MSLGINHVSINALDLKRSTDFYVELFGAEPITTPNFGIPVQWLALGRTQLHLFERDLTPTSHHHFGVTVDDVEPVYRAAERWNAFDDAAFGNRLVELPGDIVQLYIRDPAGNLVEIDHHGVDRLPDDLLVQLKGLWDFNSQDDEQMSARLFVDAPAARAGGCAARFEWPVTRGDVGQARSYAALRIAGGRPAGTLPSCPTSQSRSTRLARRTSRS